MLAVPADAGPRRHRPIDDPSRVREIADLDRAPYLCLDRLMKRLQAAFEHPVIVASPGVAGDAAAWHAVVRFFGRPRPVGEGDRDDGLRRRLQVAWIGREASAFLGEPVEPGEMAGADALHE